MRKTSTELINGPIRTFAKVIDELTEEIQKLFKDWETLTIKPWARKSKRK